MCMLTYYPEGVHVDVDALTNGAALNRDGHGFAIVTGGKITIRKSMDPEFLIADFEAMRRHHLDGPALFHSRLCTDGSVSKDNCHPFRLGGDGRTVLAHNGIMPGEVRPAKGDLRSDTRICAEIFLRDNPFGPLGNRKARRRFARWMGEWNKVAILTVDPKYGRNGYLINGHKGEWHHGVWYSNMDYRTDARHRAWEKASYWYDRWAKEDGEYTGWWDEKLAERDESRVWCGECLTESDLHSDGSCLKCGSMRIFYPSKPNDLAAKCSECLSEGTIDPDGYCNLCGACVDCGSEWTECECYVPATTRNWKAREEAAEIAAGWADIS